MSEFLKWYGKKIIDQFEDQKRVIANLKTHKDIEFCNSCFSYKHKCECEQPSEVPRDLSFTEVRNFTLEECDRYADFLMQDRFLFQDEDTFLPEPFNPEKYVPQSNTSSCGVVNRIERIDFISYCQFMYYYLLNVVFWYVSFFVRTVSIGEILEDWLCIRLENMMRKMGKRLTYQ
jgi:hypothetical protein